MAKEDGDNLLQWDTRNTGRHSKHYGKHTEDTAFHKEAQISQMQKEIVHTKRMSELHAKLVK